MIDVARNTDGEVQTAPTEHFAETQVYFGELTVQYNRAFVLHSWISAFGATVAAGGRNQVWAAAK